MSQQNRRLEAIAMTALLALTGCADSAVISTTYRDPSYVPFEFIGQGSLPVLVSGDPFSVPRDQFSANVADALQGTVLGANIPFVPAPQGSPLAYRIAMDFSGSSTAASLCARRDMPPSPPAVNAAAGDRTSVSAALCHGDRAITNASGSLPLGDGPTSAAFRIGVAQFGMALLPPQTRPGIHGNGPPAVFWLASSQRSRSGAP
jgi:hypothetical protein